MSPNKKRGHASPSASSSSPSARSNSRSADSSSPPDRPSPPSERSNSRSADSTSPSARSDSRSADSNAPASRAKSSRRTSSPPEKKLQTGFRSRKLALEILLTVERENAYANLALTGAFRNNELSERDRGFVTALVQGVLRNRMSLDESMSQLSTRPVEKLPTALKNVLLLGLFQLVFMPNMPPSAVLNPSTELAKTFGHQGLAKFANGLLRNFVRRMDKERTKSDAASGANPDLSGTLPIDVDFDAPLPLLAEPPEPKAHSRPDQLHTPVNKEQPSRPQSELARLSTAFSMPEWIIDRWLKNFGREETIALLKFSQSTPVLELRTNQMSITPEGLAQIFANEGIACRRGQLVDSCLLIDKGQRQSTPSAHKSSSFHGSPVKLPGYSEGLFSIQDE